MTRRIDQWVPALHRGDAIGDSARLMRDVFRSWGHEADVWAPDIDEDLAGDGRPYAEFASAGAGPGDVVAIAGKWHEAYQVLRDRTVPFDDRQVALDALGRLLVKGARR